MITSFFKALKSNKKKKKKEREKEREGTSSLI